MPVFSIIIPLYNQEKYIQNTIESALNQTFKDFEIIVVNDGSTDSSLAIVKQIEDSRIKIFSIKNGGVSRARNFGIEKAKSDLIAFLDADDLWRNNHLEALYKLWKDHPNCGLYAMGYSKKFDNSKPISAVFVDLNNYSGIVKDFFKSSTVDCVATSSSVVIQRFVFNEIGGFNQSLKRREDTELWIRLALRFKIAFCNEISVLILFSSYENHLSKSKNDNHSLKFYEVFRNEEKINLSLKKYLDLNRFSIALESKLNCDYHNYNILSNSINKSNLNFKQKILLKLPQQFLIVLKKIQIELHKYNVYISPYH